MKAIKFKFVKNEEVPNRKYPMSRPEELELLRVNREINRRVITNK